MADDQPGIMRSFYRFLPRYGLIIVNCLFVYWRIERINCILIKDENDGRIYNETVNLIVMIVDLVLNIIFILGTHFESMKLLKISLIGNIASVTVFTVYAICMFGYYTCSLYLQYKVSVKWKYLKPLFANLGIVTSGASIEILIAYAMLLLCNDIKELETKDYLFRFVNTSSEAKCTMECVELNETANETKGEEDRLEKEQDLKEDETEDNNISKEGASEYSSNNVSETICTIECEDRNMDEDVDDVNKHKDELPHNK